MQGQRGSDVHLYRVRIPQPTLWPGTVGWPEHRLAGLVTRDSMIGVSAARTP